MCTAALPLEFGFVTPEPEPRQATGSLQSSIATAGTPEPLSPERAGLGPPSRWSRRVRAEPAAPVSEESGCKLPVSELRPTSLRPPRLKPTQIPPCQQGPLSTASTVHRECLPAPLPQA